VRARGDRGVGRLPARVRALVGDRDRADLLRQRGAGLGVVPGLEGGPPGPDRGAAARLSGREGTAKDLKHAKETGPGDVRTHHGGTGDTEPTEKREERGRGKSGEEGRAGKREER